MRNTLSAQPSTYSQYLSEWVSEGCPHDAFYRMEITHGRMTTLGIPDWAARIVLPEAHQKGRR